MKLSQLLYGTGVKVTDDLDVLDIVYDSRKVKNGSLFVCLKGNNTDGHNYAIDAENNGAIAIVCEEKVNVKIQQYIVKSTRQAISKIFSNYYENPEKILKMIGVTGTNGKTTTTFLIKSILEAKGDCVGLIGTEGAFIGQQYINTGLTTPDPEVLFKVLKDMVNVGIKYVVMEVSAHALDLEKVFGIKFDVAVFTNLTQDHLDYFITMENYKNAKLKLFTSRNTKTAVINIDDDVGKEIMKNIDVPAISYALKNPSDIFAIEINNKLSKTDYVVNMLDNVMNVESNLLGEFNVYNSLAAAGACVVLGCDDKQIKKGLEDLKRVPGRLNSYILNNNVTVVIDFAHTPDGIEKVLKTLRQMKFKRIITVFGCGGNRDKGKRSIMGKIAENNSDFVVLTSDNPRFENPELIIDDIESGMMKKKHTRIADRDLAIFHAIDIATSGDVVAILGKGAEEYQDINGVKSPYNDYYVVKEKDEQIKIDKAISGGKI